MSVRIIKQGILDTIQDAGRYGYQYLGINPCGAMDNIAAIVANLLVGNNVSEAVIELHYPASSLLFEDVCMIALSGADFSATLGNEPLPLNTTVIVAKGSALQFRHYKQGARCYLSVNGGWIADHWLSSYSTNLKASSGGYKGRALKKNDVLKTKQPHLHFTSLAKNSSVITPVGVEASSLYASAKRIRCVEGVNHDWLTEDGKGIFLSSFFKIGLQSDRMGYQLNGTILNTRKDDKQLLSSAVIKGTIQLLPSGQLIILMADHQTTGGYPNIANVISADIPRLAQMRPNESLQFEFVRLSDAEQLYIEQQQDLQRIANEINLRYRQFFS